jgi:hypothetical protein
MYSEWKEAREHSSCMRRSVGVAVIFLTEKNIF